MPLAVVDAIQAALKARGLDVERELGRARHLDLTAVAAAAIGAQQAARQPAALSRSISATVRSSSSSSGWVAGVVPAAR